MIRRLRDQGVAILFVSHFLDQVYAISDRITVLRNGALRRRVPDPRPRATELISLMIGKDLATFAVARAERRRARGGRIAPSVPSSRPPGSGAGVRSSPPTSRCTRARCVGFAGLLGSGRTELARLLYGADKPDHGRGHDARARRSTLHSPVAGLSNRIAFSTENRRDEGIIGDLTVRENLVLAVQADEAGRGRCRGGSRTRSSTGT